MACADEGETLWVQVPQMSSYFIFILAKMSSYFHSSNTLRRYYPLGTMLLVLCSLQFMFYTTCGCIYEEKFALIRIRSSLVDAKSEVPASWVQNTDCCSWERVRCNENSKRMSDLDLSVINSPQATSATEGIISATEGECNFNLDLTIFSSFHELQLLDISWNSACLRNFDGLQGLTKLRYLNLTGNNFIGHNNFGYLNSLASLEVINLADNNISATLHDIAFRNLSNLRELHLGSNRFSGGIPTSLFELPHLEYVDLSGNLLQGHIPMGLSSNLSSLRTLKLARNNLSGMFEFFWLKNCTMLKMVDLSENTGLAVDVKFRGRVPLFQLKALSLSGCKLDKSIIAGSSFLGTQRYLRVLDLSNNNLTGSLPKWIFTDIVALIYLDISNNSLFGSLDPMWQYQSNLQMINVSTNYFVGHLPANISYVLPNITVLDASHNILSGHLPPLICNISSLTLMDLSNNEFVGEVPTCIFTDFPMLQILKLSNNNLGGSIFGGASSLSVPAIFLDTNQFIGTLPSNLSGITEIMDLHNNKLSGKLNASFWNLTSLLVLSVARNNLSGEICPAVCKLTSLQLLDLSDNNFSGCIPNCTRKLTLIFLNVSGNSLSGFPNVFFNSSYVTALDLKYNQFTGNLDWIQHLVWIQMLLLGGNQFEGQISQNLCDLHYLNILDFSNNRLSGPIPRCVGGISFGYDIDDLGSSWSLGYIDFGTGFGDSNMDYDDQSFVYIGRYDLQGFTFSTKGNIYAYDHNFLNLMFGIDLSANMLSGEIPWEIGNLSRVKSLNLSHNLLSGMIPINFANMTSIESLDLSYNELSGPIPFQLSQLWFLEVFSVAYNNLSGCIPNSGQFNSFSTDSYAGNINLQNISQGAGCPPNSGQVEEDDVDNNAFSDPVLYTIGAASFVVVFWATVAFLLCHPFSRHVILEL